MLKNYFSIAFRNLFASRGYSLINIAGLAIGIAVCLLIFLWVRDEWNFDRFNDDPERIFRVVEVQQQSGDPFPVAVTPAPLAPAMKEDFPEVELATTVYSLLSMKISTGENEFSGQLGGMATEDFFRIFNYGLLQGDPALLLSDPYSIVLTESAARRYFGEDEPVGKVVKVQERYDLKVTGIIKDVPRNSHLQFDYLIPFQLLAEIGYDLNEWGSNSYYSYVKLRADSDPADFAPKIKNYLMDHECGYEVYLHLQPLLEIHLKSDFVADISGHGKLIYVHIFSIVAILVLIIACINFMNLSTARAAKRAKEVGVRKLIGAHRRNLIGQFLGESFLITLFAVILALILVELMFARFNQITGKELKIDFSDNVFWIGLVLITIITAFLAGSYPAFVLSAFKSLYIMKGVITRGKKGASFRKILVVVQFALSIILIISAITISRQLNYIRNRDLGYNKDQILSLRFPGNTGSSYKSCKEEIKKVAGVINVTSSSQLPINIVSSGYGILWEGKDEEYRPLVHILTADYDFFETFEMEFVHGRGFSPQLASDSASCIINETLLRMIGNDEPIGMKVGYYSSELDDVIGVVKNFNFKTLYREIEPLIIKLYPDGLSYLFIKVSSTGIEETIARIKMVWEEMLPTVKFAYTFLDDYFADQYRAEARMGTLINYFTGLAIFIAALGLLGLAFFTAESRLKEIGIRKVMGASIPAITCLLIKDFTRWVFLANLVAWPVSYLVAKKWLNNFAYRTDINPWFFVLSGILTLLIAIFTVIFQTVKVANLNPVKIIKYE